MSKHHGLGRFVTLMAAIVAGMGVGGYVEAHNADIPAQPLITCSTMAAETYEGTTIQDCTTNSGAHWYGAPDDTKKA